MAKRRRRKTCKSYKVRCAGKLYRCHPGAKHRKGMYCKLISRKKRRSRRSRR